MLFKETEPTKLIKSKKENEIASLKKQCLYCKYQHNSEEEIVQCMYDLYGHTDNNINNL